MNEDLRSDPISNFCQPDADPGSFALLEVLGDTAFLHIIIGPQSSAACERRLQPHARFKSGNGQAGAAVRNPAGFSPLFTMTRTLGVKDFANLVH